MPQRFRPPSALDRMHRQSAPAVRPLLERVAQLIMNRAPAVIEPCVAAGHSPVIIGGYLERPDIVDRAWRFTNEGRQIFCVMERCSQSLLLTWLTAGQRRDEFSALEKNIVAECVREMLSAGQREVEVIEEPRVRPIGAAWRCDINLRDRDDGIVILQLYACMDTHAAPAQLGLRPTIVHVPLTLQAVLPTTSCSLLEVRAWRAGSIVSYTHPSSEVTVTVVADRRRIALAQLGAVQERRAIRLITLGALS